jgi:hypothetical protein
VITRGRIKRQHLIEALATERTREAQADSLGLAETSSLNRLLRQQRIKSKTVNGVRIVIVRKP